MEYTEEYLTDVVRGLTAYIFNLRRETQRSDLTKKRRKEIKEIIEYNTERIRRIAEDIKKK